MTPRVLYFSDPLPDGCGDPKMLLGGKGASLKDMTLAGLRVRPGFTIAADCCREYFDAGRNWPEGLEREVRKNLVRLEQETGRTFGEGSRPLLVSVRSGAAVSMPGMMDTILNCGLHPGLAGDVGDAPAFWELYIQFIEMFAKVVGGLGADAFADARRGRDKTAPADRPLAEEHLGIYARLTGRRFPVTPWDALRECINAVFESWNSERAIEYRKHNDIRGLPGTAVNVQMMFPSQVSGIVFTQDPNDLIANRMIVEAAYGLGESVVSGDVTPDRFLIRRDDLAVLSSEIGHKHCAVHALEGGRAFDPDSPSLSGEQVRELAELALKIERHFDHPVDIEFGWADGQFSLLQSRRIRGLEIAEDIDIAREEEIFRLRSLAGDRHTLWVAHNLGETLRFPTPLTWDVVRSFMSGDGGFGRMYRRLGYRPSQRACRDGFLELICGRIYADPDRQAELFWDAMPLTYDLEALLASRGATELMEGPPTKFDPQRADGRFLARLPGTVVAMMRASRRLKAVRREARRHFEQDVLPPYLEYVREKRQQDLSPLSDAQVAEEFHARRRRVLDEFGPDSLVPGFFGGLALGGLERLLKQLMGEQNGAELARSLTGALEGDTTLQQNAMLQAVADGEASMAEFIEKYGHRCVGEMELAEPRWREDSRYCQQMVGRLRGGRGTGEVHGRKLAERQKAQRELPDVLRQWGGSCLREQIEADMADAQQLLPYRESGKHYLMMGYELIRQASQELSRRWNLGKRLYFLQAMELECCSRGPEAFADQLKRRHIRWQAFQRLEPANVLDSEDLQGLGLALKLEAASELVGSAVASGLATGTAAIVYDPQDAGELASDFVLVCPSTDPGWTPLFASARALVVERGGVLSHGAIVARDFGIPAVVVPNATKLIANGAHIRVDGNKGVVTVITGEAGASPE